MDTYQLERFKQCEAKFDLNKFTLVDDTQGVVADWSNSSVWPVFKGSDWQIDKSPSIYKNSTGTSQEWYHRKGKETLEIEIMVSSTGNKAAFDRLIEHASNTTMMEIPYNKATGLGDLYINFVHVHNRTHIWIYRNICFMIDHTFEGVKNPGLDSNILAKEIQKYAEEHLVTNIPAYYPKIVRAEISQPKIHVGDSFRATLIMADKTSMDNYVIESRISGNLGNMSREGVPVNAKAVKAVEPGTGEVTFSVIDKKTLLSAQKTVTFKVLENGN